MRILSFVAVALFAASAFAAHLTEKQKIDVLLDSFEKQHVTFIRNNESHDADYAERHLKEKLLITKDVDTAEDFIAKVATKSSHTGEAYKVKLADGTTEDAATFLHAELKKLEAK